MYINKGVIKMTNEEQEIRESMIQSLHNERFWTKWADGYISCPICGATIHPQIKIIHITWHERNNR